MMVMNQPLAYRMRPTHLDEILGQSHLLGENKFLTNMIKNQSLCSMIFFGPPGTGKTTLAICIANTLKTPYQMLNAVTCNKKDLEGAILEAKMKDGLVLIVDEVHRLNKDKQDILLPHLENGLIILLGATTANPYHAINKAIRSRCHLVEIKPLTQEDIVIALKKALDAPQGLNQRYQAQQDALETLAQLSGGDLRFALNQLEIASFSAPTSLITKEIILDICQKANTILDADEDGHYDAVSALQKSIRGSDVDAALYYLARLIAYEDLESIERRLLVTAYEDIGLANPSAVDRTFNAIQTAKIVGFPEAMIPLGFAVIDLALSPKSKSACQAIHRAVDLVKQQNFSIPEYLRLTPVNLKKEDQYDYENEESWVQIQYLPSLIRHLHFYYPNYKSGPYELSLIKNYQQLQKINRTSRLKDLKKK